MSGIENLTIIGSAVTMTGIISGFIWKVSRSVDERLNRYLKDGEDKRARIYERFDEYKETGKKDFVLTQVCSEVHKRTDETMKRIEASLEDVQNDIKKILLQVNGKNGR